jgi:cytochrome c6
MTGQQIEGRQIMRNSIKMTVLGCVAAGMILVAGCGREEPQEPVGNAGGADAMPMDMEHDMADGMQDMGDAERDMMAETTNDGAALFQQHCAVCHPDGGNIINPEKPLHRDALEENGVTSTADIVAIMRNPGPGMTTFGPEAVSDAQAEKIAEHILATY